MTYTRGKIYIVNLKSMMESERGLFDLVGRYIIKDMEDFMPKKNKDIQKTLTEEVKIDE